MAAAGLLSLAACGSPRAGGVHDLCPGCLATDYAGAFTAPSPYCTPQLVAAPVTDAVAQEFDLAHIIELARGGFDSDLRWELDPHPPADTSAPGGYQPKTRVQGTLALGDPAYYDGGPVSAGPFGCARMIKVPAVVQVSTADGAIGGAEAQGALTILAGDFPGRWRLEAYADLATVTGRLDLRLDPSAAKRGYLHVAMIPSGSDQGPRGQISPQVLTFQTLQAALAYDPRSDVINAQPSYPIAARWPDDACDFDRMPIDASAPHPWLQGDSFAARLAAAKEAVGIDRPQPGRWFGAGEASVVVNVGTPSQACLADDSGHLSFKFDTDARISTSDGRMATLVPHGYLSLADQLGMRNVLDLGLAIERAPTGAFEAKAGLRNIETAGSPWLSGTFDAWFGWDEGQSVEMEGTVEIEGAPACGTPGVTCGNAFVPEYGTYVTCLKWPASKAFSELCGRYLR